MFLLTGGRVLVWDKIERLGCGSEEKTWYSWRKKGQSLDHFIVIYYVIVIIIIVVVVVVVVVACCHCTAIHAEVFCSW